jgi:Trypsin-co-occurring domain 1
VIAIKEGGAMAQITEFKLPSGDVVLVEAEEEPRAAGEARAGIGDTIRSWMRRGDDGQPAVLNERVQPLAQALQSIRLTLSGVVTGMDEMVLEAGLKFVGEAGVVLSKVSTEASISISLKWKPSSTDSAR